MFDHMAQIVHDLLDEDRILAEIHLRSGVVKEEDVVALNRLAVGEEIRGRAKGGRLSYWAGDALDVPLHDGSLSCIACIYFIDVVHVQSFLKEVRRLLKPGGLLVNLGPLRYPRGDATVMLCGEELLSMYARSGFEILASDIVPNTQLESSFRITTVFSNNFMFAARRLS